MLFLKCVRICAEQKNNFFGGKINFLLGNFEFNFERYANKLNRCEVDVNNNNNNDDDDVVL